MYILSQIWNGWGYLKLQTALSKDIGKNKRRRFPVWAMIMIAAVLLSLGAFLTIRHLRTKRLAETVQQQRTAAVTKGSLSVSLSGSGSLTPAVREEISSAVSGDVLKVNCETGQKVNEGRMLIEIDRTDAKLNYQKLVNALERERLTFEDLEKKIDSLEITAPFSGWVTGVSVREGDTLKENTPVMTLTNKSELEITVPFRPSDIKSLKKGDSTTVNVQDLMQQIQGRVSYIGPDTYVTSDGIMARDVTVNVQNPGLLAEGMRAGISLENNAASLDMGTLEYIESTVVKSDAPGDVAKVNVLENCYVKESEPLVLLENSDLILSRDNASLSLKEMELQVEQAQKQLEDYNITSPINGTIVNMKRINKGDSIKAGTVLMEIVNTNIMEFDVAVDELDITKVETGQEVRVTVDAIEETLTAPLSGTVSNIAIESKSISGVTTYPVTITLDGTEKLLGGMNANAEILVQNKQNALLVPIEAVTVMGEFSYVWGKGERPEQENPVTQENAGSGIQRSRQGIQLTEEQKNNLRDALEESGGDRQALREKFKEMRQKQQVQLVQADSYYDGAYRKIVKTGAHNETHMEILSGLNEGDIVVLPPLASGESSSSSQEERQRSPFGIPGGGFRR